MRDFFCLLFPEAAKSCRSWPKQKTAGKKILLSAKSTIAKMMRWVKIKEVKAEADVPVRPS